MEHNCTTIPTDITEMKMAPSCTNMTKVWFVLVCFWKVCFLLGPYVQVSVKPERLSLSLFLRMFARKCGFLTLLTGKMSTASKSEMSLNLDFKSYQRASEGQNAIQLSTYSVTSIQSWLAQIKIIKF